VRLTLLPRCFIHLTLCVVLGSATARLVSWPFSLYVLNILQCSKRAHNGSVHVNFTKYIFLTRVVYSFYVSTT